MNTQTKVNLYTPGPWSSDRARDFAGRKQFDVWAGSALIAENCREANARLIAVAPEMLELLRRITSCGYSSPESLVEMAQNEAIAIIAKVEGGAS